MEKRLGKMFNSSQSARNAVIWGWAICNSATSTVFSGMRPCHPNHAGVKIDGLKLPSKTSDAPVISGLIRNLPKSHSL